MKESAKHSKARPSRRIQNKTENKGTITDPMDDYPDMNEPSLVNTLTTSLGGIVSKKHHENVGGFMPSPTNLDSSTNLHESAKKNPAGNKLKSYLKSNKEKHGRAIVEQDESDATRISYTTKNAHAPGKLNFSMRQSNLSPISSNKKHLSKRNKEMSKRRKRIKKHIKDNMLNESFQKSMSSKRSQIDKEEHEMLKSVYVMMNQEGVRPMTVPHPEKATGGTKYEDDNLRESVVNIDKSEDSEFFHAQVFMKPIKDSARGWSSKHPRNRRVVHNDLESRY